jgi:hypothetical protein
VRGCEALRGLLDAGEEGQARVQRVLSVSRGHPLILERLCTLAADPEGLDQALDTLAQRGYAHLPDLFAGQLDDKAKEAQRTYREDVAVGAVDLLLQRASPEQRRMLWVVTLAQGPVDEAMVAGVVGGVRGAGANAAAAGIV